MKNILITGSEGYIGSVMVPFFLEKGFKVTGLDSCFFSEGNLNHTYLPKYKLIKKDIRKVELSDLDSIDAVIHLAGLSNDPLGMLNENLTYDINYHASVRLAELAKSAKIDRFIFSSSCSLYGKGEGKALTEEGAQNPQTAYAKSKVLTEEALVKLADKNFCPTYMRNATAYGISPRMRFDLVVNSLSGFAHATNEIKIMGDGTPWRPLVHVKDITKAFYLALTADRNKVWNQAFNVGKSSENYQIKSIAEVVKMRYPTCDIKIMQKDAGDSRDYNVSFDKIEKTLGFINDWTVPQGVDEAKACFSLVKMNNDLFNHRFYTRLTQIQFLLENKKINSELFI